jgi:hypothetical protein
MLLTRRLLALLLTAPALAVAAGESDATGRSPDGLQSFIFGPPFPSRITLDELSQAEVRDLHSQVAAKWGSRKCLAWVYAVAGGHSKVVGMFMPWGWGGGALKINGQIRHGLADGYKPQYQEAVGKSKLEIYVNSFEPSRSFFQDPKEPPTGAKTLGISSSNIRTTKKSASCSLAKARCRQYTGNFHLSWGGSGASEAANYAEVELLVEDMCPATSEGLIEGAFIGRLGKSGDEISARKKGIPGNPPLSKALK